MPEKECANCEYFDITQNKCYIDGRKGYDKGKLIVNNCDNYELGHWGIPEEIERRTENA